MATPLRKQSSSIEKQLLEKPYEFEFSQAVKLLEILYDRKSRIGETAQAHHEAVRLKSNILLSTPPSDLYSLIPAEFADTPANLTINFMGIAGQTGPLPSVYSELILERIKSKDYAFRDFLDIFNHRLNSIHYRIQVKYNFSLNRELPPATEAAMVLKYLSGMNNDIEKLTTHYINPRSYIKYSGLMWQKPRSAIGLEVMLKDFFQLPFAVKQFIGQWTQLEKDQCTCIGKKAQYNILGENAALGTKAWIHSEKLRIKVGPLTIKDYKAMLPDKDKNIIVSEFIRHYLGCEDYFDYEISLKQEQAPPTILDGKSALGWTSWINIKDQNFIPETIVVKANDALSNSR